jgi:hypothetical protein
MSAVRAPGAVGRGAAKIIEPVLPASSPRSNSGGPDRARLTDLLFVLRGGTTEAVIETVTGEFPMWLVAGSIRSRPRDRGG